MELRHLRYFIAASEELHFGRASERLSVTRPAVSQTIADLEEELGVRLFLRQAHKVTLTAAGQSFLKAAQGLLQDLNSAVQVARRIGQGKVGLLTIGYGSLSLLQPLFRDAIKEMGRSYPDTVIALQEVTSHKQIEAVRSGRLDAGFVYVARGAAERQTSVPGASNLIDLNSLKIQEGGIGVAVPPDHPLAGRKALDLADLEGEGFIVVHGASVNPHIGSTLKVVQEVSNIATQLNLISVGMGVGLVVTGSGLQYPDSIRVVPLRNVDFISEFRLVWRRGPTEQLLLNFVETVRTLTRLHAERPRDAAR